MGLLEDILKALERVPGWKRINETPDRVDSLEGRVAALEEKLGGKWPPDVCKACGERALRLERTSADMDEGRVMEVWDCESCHTEEKRILRAR